MTEDVSNIEPLPVLGYTNQSIDNIELVNTNKQLEEAILMVLDALTELDTVNQRWLAIGRTQIEQGFMAVNRSIFNPQRVELDLLKE